MEMENRFSNEQINCQLQRILNFYAFRNSPILTKFLEFIVAGTILDEKSTIKEYSIAVNVLNRRLNFNPHDDAVVRIHAGRLRRALNDYYLTEGIYDPILIHIPKGSYIPKFCEGPTLKHSDESLHLLPASNVKPILAIFPFRTTFQRQDINDFFLLLGEQLSAELSKFQDLTVIGYYSVDMKAKIDQNILDAGRSVGADHIVAGSLQHNEHYVRILVNLITATTGEVLATKCCKEDISSQDIFEIQDQIVQNIIIELRKYYDIFFHKIAQEAPTRDFH